MKQAATRELYRYWNQLRGERASPDRSQIDPSAIRGILADTFILEVDQDKHYPFRLSGTRLNALLMRELKAQSFAALWQGRDRTDLHDTLHFLCQEAKGVVFGVTAYSHFSQSIDLEMLLLPVRHFGRTHARILGCITPSQVPNWMGLVPAERLTLTGLRILPQLETAPAGSRPDAAVGEISGHRDQAAAGVSAAGAVRTERYRHLVLHDFGRQAK